MFVGNHRNPEISYARVVPLACSAPAMAQPYPGALQVPAGRVPVPLGRMAAPAGNHAPRIAIQLQQQQKAVPNQYFHPHQSVQNMGHSNTEGPSVPLQQNSSYGVVPPGREVDAPPPLPPKPMQRPPAGAQFPPRQAGGPLNNLSGTAPAPRQPNYQPRFYPPPPNALPSTVGRNGDYAHVLDPKMQEINRLRSVVSDIESKLRERELELSRSNSDLVKCRKCLHDKKEEIGQKENEVERLGEEMKQLRQIASTSHPQPQVARNEAALQSEVEHYRRVVRELTAQLEEVRRHNVALPPAGTDVHELMRLREEVQWHHGERQRMLGQIGVFRSSEEVLTAQVKTYQEDFEIERGDRERAHERMSKMQEEVANLTHIVTMLGGENQEGNFNPP